MTLPREGQLLRIFLGESDHHHHRPTWQAIVELARAEGLAGTTVLRGIAGFGRSSRLHTSSVLRLSQDLPIVVEIVDTSERLDAFLPKLEPLLEGCLLTRERAEVLVYRSKA